MSARGEFFPKEHGNTKNTNASAIDENQLAEWFLNFADRGDDTVPVRVRLKTGALTNRLYFSHVDYTLIPPAFTWDRLRAEYTTYLDSQ